MVKENELRLAFVKYVLSLEYMAFCTSAQSPMKSDFFFPTFI